MLLCSRLLDLALPDYSWFEVDASGFDIPHVKSKFQPKEYDLWHLFFVLFFCNDALFRGQILGYLEPQFRGSECDYLLVFLRRPVPPPSWRGWCSPEVSRMISPDKPTSSDFKTTWTNQGKTFIKQILQRFAEYLLMKHYSRKKKLPRTKIFEHLNW